MILIYCQQLDVISGKLRRDGFHRREEEEEEYCDYILSEDVRDKPFFGIVNPNFSNFKIQMKKKGEGQWQSIWKRS